MPEATFIALMYHALGESPRGGYTLAWRQFAEHLDLLREGGYVIEGFSGLERRLHSGEWPVRYVVLTFDDGHGSLLRAAEVLGQYAAGATFFLTRDLCRTMPGYLAAAEIRELAAHSEVGSHGITHAPLSHLPESLARAELTDSRAWLEDLCGREIRYLSAPGGYWNQRVQRWAEEVGYRLVGNSCEWWNRGPVISRTGQVHRVALRPHFDRSTMRRILEGDFAFFAVRRLRSLGLAIPRYCRARWVVRRRAGGPERNGPA